MSADRPEKTDKSLSIDQRLAGMLGGTDFGTPVVLATTNTRGDIEVWAADSCELMIVLESRDSRVVTKVEATIQGLTAGAQIPAFTTHATIYLLDAIEGPTIIELLDVDFWWKDGCRTTVVGSTDYLHQAHGPPEHTEQ